MRGLFFSKKQIFVLTLFFSFLYTMPSIAQITTGGTSSSVINLQTTNKGVLIPRMTQTERESILSPATGLLVYQIDNKSGFYFFGGTAWKILGATNTLIQDTDGNTKVQVEKNYNENIVRFDLDGSEKLTLKKNSSGDSRIEFPSNIGGLFIGNNAAQNSSVASNFALGDSAMFNQTNGVENFAIGKKTLFTNSSGDRNFAIGNSALYNSVADSNFAIGHFALRDNTLGKLNLSIGSNSLLNNETGNENLAIGFQALQDNTLGSRNTAIGNNALKLNLEGNNNTVIGKDVALNSKIGFENTVIGTLSTLTNNFDGYQNALIGHNAMYSSVSSYQNTAIGINSLSSLSTGSRNTSIGENGLSNLSSGDFNTLFGKNSGGALTSGYYNTIIGNSLITNYGNNSNNIFVGNAAGFFYSSAGSENVVVGDSTYFNNNKNTIIGNLSGQVDEGNITLLGNDHRINSINKGDVVVLGKPSNFLRVGIGTTNPHPNAVLELNSTSKGFLPPRLTKNQMENLPYKKGSLVYNTTKKALYYNTTPVPGFISAGNVFERSSNLFNADNKIPVYKNGSWQWTSTSQIVDVDNNSKVEIERNTNDNKFRVKLNGIDRFLIKSNSYGKYQYEFLSENDCLYLGNNAGANADVSADNTGIGYDVLKNVNISGINNTGIGHQTLINNSSGQGNTALGKSVMSANTSGSYNTAIGLNALDANTNGNYNTAIGTNAFKQDDNGNNNTAIGAYAEIDGSLINNATAVGYRAKAVQSNSLVLGSIDGINNANATAKVGIGTTDPEYPLQVENENLSEFKSLITFEEPTIEYSWVQFKNSNTTNRWSWKTRSSGVITDQRFIFHYINDLLTIDGSGDAILLGNVVNSSDKKLKKNIARLPFSWSNFEKVNAYKYKWKDPNKSPSTQIGFIAQNVENSMPHLVKTDANIKSVNYFGMVPYLLEGLKFVDKHQKSNNETLDEIDDQLSKLESHIKIKK